MHETNHLLMFSKHHINYFLLTVLLAWTTVLGISAQGYYVHPDPTSVSWIWYAIAAVSLLLLFFMCGYIYFIVVLRKEEQQYEWQSERLKNTLTFSHIRLFTYHADTKLFIIFRQNGESTIDFKTEEVRAQFPPDQFELLMQTIEQILNGEQETVPLSLSMNFDSTGRLGSGRVDLTLSAVKNKDGEIREIIGTAVDITAELLRQRVAKEHLLRYESVFHTVMLDVVAYDANGVVTDMNERCQQLFGTTIEEARRNKLSYNQAIDPHDLPEDEHEVFHATLLLDPETGQRALRPIKASEAFCYELKMVPVFDNNKRMLGYYGSGMNVNERAQTYRQIQQSSRQVVQTTKLIRDYMNDIDYVMSSGGAYISIYYPTTHTLTIYKQVNVVLQEFTQSTAITMLKIESRKKAVEMFAKMDALTDVNIDCTVKTVRLHKGKPVCYHLEMIPVHNDAGEVVSYFGICRDVSDLENTRQMLEEETAYAQLVESQKNAFMHDMSYEIRTPLNTVVGFAELLKQNFPKADEDFFITQIKESSSFLLHLINSILFISRLDAHMVEIEKHFTDFSKSFANHCLAGWEDYRQEGVEYEVEMPFEELEIEIDDQNVGHIIEQLTANAAQHTSKGSVSAICDYRNDALTITVTDTGDGISESMLEHVFKRFAASSDHSAGLGLPICQELATQMGGTIQISSQLHHGTTVRLTLPCAVRTIRRKEEPSC